jgi:hypothetical protein
MPGKLAAAAVLSDERGEKSTHGKRSLLSKANTAWRLRKILD